MDFDPIKSAVSGAVGAILDKVVSVYKAAFTTNRDTQIGALGEINKGQAEVIQNAETAKEISDRVDGMSDDELERVRVQLNKNTPAGS